MSQSSSRLSDPASLELHRQLRALHADDVVSARQPTNLLSQAANFYLKSSTRMYLLYVGKQISQIFKSRGIKEAIVTMIISLIMIATLALGLFVTVLFRLPIVGVPFSWFSIRAAHGLGLTNMFFPTMFQQLTPEELEAAKFALSQPWSQTDPNLKLFDVDVAKLLLQIASIVYERAPEPVQEAMHLVDQHQPAEKERSVQDSTVKPGVFARNLLGGDGLKTLQKALATKATGADAMEDFCSRHGLDYESISELNSDRAAFTSAFWDPKGSWIVLAFKGTSPVAFDEWITDFSTTLVETNKAWLPGFGKVHHGFQERMFPSLRLSDLRQPYHTIRESIQIIATHLRGRQPPGTPINVFFTGHSLGCATATLAFLRAKAYPDDFGPHVTVRDAFLFGAPVVCDAGFAREFERVMQDSTSTMWRVTNHGDVVASALPEGGDRVDADKNDVWAFAHLGTEIKLEPAPYSSHVVKSARMQPPMQVLLHSSLNAFTRPRVNLGKISLQAAVIEHIQTAVQLLSSKQQAVHAQDRVVPKPLSSTLLLCQEIPVCGRFLAHFPMYYWDRLARAQLGICEWVED